MSDSRVSSTKFQVFRRADVAPLTAEQFYGAATATPEQRESMEDLLAAGWAEGEEARILFTAPGFALVHAWFKAGYPLPRHSHDADGLYVVISGSLSLGTEHLEAGDGFFVPANAPYTYEPGPDGVEVLEFRHTATVDFRILASGAAYWSKSLQRVAERRADWSKARRPGC